jgi:hypothetical protein
MTSESPSIFVDGLDLSGVIRTGTTKQFHRKSRTGCQRCRIRRVKVNFNRNPNIAADSRNSKLTALAE